MGAQLYDYLVIGGGSGGIASARRAAQYGASVALIENNRMGGTCVNVGCVPKKLFVYGSHYSEDFEDANAYGWTAGPSTFAWPTLRDNKTREIERLNGIYKNLLEGAGAEIIDARAVLTDPNSIAVDGTTVTAENILVATGSWPSIPSFPGDRSSSPETTARRCTAGRRARPGISSTSPTTATRT